MSDKPGKVEKLGIEHIGEEMRHGSPRRTFTLWFAANLTIADYVIGVLTTTSFGFTVGQAVPILFIGNLLGGLFLGLAAAMGPALGFPQMFSSRASFGRIGNYLPGGLNWISTVGWFSVNTILAVLALQVVVPGADFVLAAGAYVLVQTVIAIYGHDFIHLFEKVMSVILGLLFLLIFVLAVQRLPPTFTALSFITGPPLTLGAVGLLLVVSFSYLMSWSPYASDYSRYLSTGTSKLRIGLLALSGGAISSFAVEVVGALVGSLTPGQSSYFSGLFSFAGVFGGLAMLTLILGAFAADALNLYTNSLSALVLDIKASRLKTVAAGGLVGFFIAVSVGSSFELFFESFLLALSYWIMPWLAIVLVDFYVSRLTTVDRASKAARFDFKALGIYAFSIAVSVPFMVPLLPYPYPIGALKDLFGGADLSYFVSFGVAGFLAYAVRLRAEPRA